VEREIRVERYLTGVHLIDVYFKDMYMQKVFPEMGKPPDSPPYKWWSICRDLSCKIRVFVLVCPGPSESVTLRGSNWPNFGCAGA
jgi:hypothetical protein